MEQQPIETSKLEERDEVDGLLLPVSLFELKLCKSHKDFCVKPSNIHGYELFSVRSFQPNDFVIKFEGYIITPADAD